MARESLFDAFAQELAPALADLLANWMTRGAPQNREAAYLTIMSLIYAKGARVAGGERVYVPLSNEIEREQVRVRIAQAIQAGEPPPVIARREGVTERHVRKVRGTIRP